VVTALRRSSSGGIVVFPSQMARREAMLRKIRVSTARGLTKMALREGQVWDRKYDARKTLNNGLGSRQPSVPDGGGSLPESSDGEPPHRQGELLQVPPCGTRCSRLGCPTPPPINMSIQPAVFRLADVCQGACWTASIPFWGQSGRSSDRSPSGPRGSLIDVRSHHPSAGGPVQSGALRRWCTCSRGG
jgi:hypothetical protein